MPTDQRLGLFIDGPNHTQAAEKAKVRIDYGLFLHQLKQNFNVVSARWYSGRTEDAKGKGVHDFLGALASKGYTPVTKLPKELPDGSMKCNMDVEIAVDILTMASRLDRVMLLSGDGDFRYLVDTIQRRGIYVTVVGHRSSVAVELREQANEFLDVKDLRNQV